MARKNRRTTAPEWLKLDNAAKIYPAVMSRKWMALYRISVTLKDDIDEALLAKALASTLKRIPFFAYRLRRGFFWYYLDRQQTAPAIEEDVANPCVRMVINSDNPHLFRVRCWRRRIAIEVFHALTDGTGGMTFLMTMTAEYMRLKYGIAPAAAPYVLDIRQNASQAEFEDSFLKYARKAVRARTEEKAYPLQGTPGDSDYLHVITGIVPTMQLYELAKRYGATINTFMAALMLQSLCDIVRRDPSKRRRKLPVKVSMPVNLRAFYPSATLRNFSSYINAGIHLSYGSYTLEEIINQVKHFAGMEMTEQMLNARFSANVAAEQNKVLRMAPLFVKTAVLRFMYWLTGERYFTTTLSNLGQLKLPDSMAQHIDRADLILGPAKNNACSCGCLSINGYTYISFSSKIRETDFERGFFTALVKLGVPVKIESNRRNLACHIASTAE
ncbi:MAG: hypothetical protein ACOX63_07570 [Christensenellales bacterium]|jgi:NRPS condensation-like uncharacterized protein